MTDAFTFSVHGTPRPKARPRFVRGRVITTTGELEKLWRTWLKRAIDEAVRHRGDPKPLFTGAVKVTMRFTFAPPAGKRDRIGKPHTHKPDKDNLEKLCLDLMTKAGVLKDDSQVADGPVQKLWGERAGVVVLVEPLGCEPAAITRPEGDAPDWLG